MRPDERVTESYRGIARETPGASLDAAILAASRRALRPSAARRWGAPVSIAAVLVLAFGLTLEMRHEEPGVESSLPTRPAIQETPAPPASPAGERPAAEPERAKVAPAPAPAPALRSQSIARPAKPAPAAAPAAKESKPMMAPLDKDKSEAAPAAERNAPAAFPASPPPASAPPAQPPAAAAAPMRAEPSAAKRPAAAEELNVAPAYAPRAKATQDTMQRAQGAIAIPPEMRDLERIAQLRSEGRDAEADKALDDFRRDHPDYRIPEAMWERVKPR